MGEFQSSSAGRELQPSSASRDLVLVGEHAEAEPAGGTASCNSDTGSPSLDSISRPPRRSLSSSPLRARCFWRIDNRPRRWPSGGRNGVAGSHHQISEGAPRCDRRRHVERRSGRPASVGWGDQVDGCFDTGNYRRSDPTLPTRRQTGPRSRAKVDKLTERVDHEASAVTAGLNTRIDKLEQKIAAAPPRPRSVALPKRSLLFPNSTM